MLRSLKLPNGFWWDFWIDTAIQTEGLYVYDMHKVEKHFSISIAPVRSRSGSLFDYKKSLY
jgi:hypothetical protein